MASSLSNPLQSRWGVGGNTFKPGEIYIGGQQRYDGRGLRTTDKTVPVQTAAAAWASLSPAAQQKIYQDAIKVYGHSKIPTLNLPSFYADTVNNAYQVQQSTGLKVTPLDYWDYYQQAGGPGLNAYGAGGAGGASGPKTTITETESVNLTDPATARGVFESAISTYLGRRPTEQETKMALSALQAQEEASPDITVTETTTTPSGSVSKVKSKSRSTGGFNSQQYAKEYARGMEGAGETTAATDLFDAFIELIGQ